MRFQDNWNPHGSSEVNKYLKGIISGSWNDRKLPYYEFCTLTVAIDTDPKNGLIEINTLKQT